MDTLMETGPRHARWRISAQSRWVRATSPQYLQRHPEARDPTKEWVTVSRGILGIARPLGLSGSRDLHRLRSRAPAPRAAVELARSLLTSRAKVAVRSATGIKSTPPVFASSVRLLPSQSNRDPPSEAANARV